MTIQRAKKFAIEKHKGQKRKFKGEPYYSHLEKVFKIVKENEKLKTKEILAAAYLHDTLEDTNTTEKEIKENFGDLTLNLVKELTINKKEARIIGKKEYLANKLSDPNKISDFALSIKLADRLDNVSDLQEGPLDFKKRYIEETKHIIKTLEEKRKMSFSQRELVKKIKEKIK